MTTVAVGSRSFGDSERSDDVGAGGGSGEQAFLPGQATRHLLSVLAGHLIQGVHEIRVPQRGKETDTDALDPVRPGGPSRQHRGLRGFNAHHPDAGMVAAQDLSDAMDRVGRPDRLHEGVDLPAGLLPDLLAHRLVPAHGVFVVELVGPPMPWSAADRVGRVDHSFDELFGDAPPVAGLIGDPRTERQHGLALLVAEGIGEDRMELVAEGRTHKCQRDARRAGGVLDDGSACCEPPVCYSRLDGSDCHPVFHRAGRVGRFELDQNPAARRRRHRPKLDDRRVADAAEDPSMLLAARHRCSFIPITWSHKTPRIASPGGRTRRSLPRVVEESFTEFSMTEGHFACRYLGRWRSRLGLRSPW